MAAPSTPATNDSTYSGHVNASDPQVVSTCRANFRQRAAARRSRAGCVTCKARHIRCDEGRPSCKKCLKSKRACGGYEEVMPRRKKQDPSVGFKVKGFRHTLSSVHEYEVCSSISRPVSENHLPELEWRAFDYFRDRTLRMLRGTFPPQKWHTTILSSGYSMPVVTDAIVAVATLHRISESSLLSETEHNQREVQNQEVLALQRYTKALTTTRTCIQEESLPSSTLRLLCLLFTVFENLRRLPSNMSTHVKMGTILAEPQSEHVSSAVDEEIAQIFRRLALFHDLRLSRRWDESGFDLPHRPFSNFLGTSFSHFEQARTVLDDTLYSIFQHTKDVKRTNYNLTPAMLSTQAGLRERLELWRASFDQLLATSIPLQGAEKILDSQHLLATIFLECSTENEMSYDRFETEFSQAVTSCFACITKDVAETSNMFSFGQGIICALAFIAAKCRHSLIRRRAVEALEMLPKWDGPWDSREVGLISRIIIEFEESHATFDENGHLSCLEEENRVHDTCVKDAGPGTGSPKTLVLILKRAGQYSTMTELYFPLEG